VTLATLTQPAALGALFVWSFAVLSAAQLTIRLIRAYSVPQTLVAAALLTVGALVVAGIYDLLLGADASLAKHLQLAPVAMFIMAVVGFSIARWVLRIRRLRGQVIGGLMVGLLDPHLFTVLSG
jgi:hypothetical protein